MERAGSSSGFRARSGSWERLRHGRVTAVLWSAASCRRRSLTVYGGRAVPGWRKPKAPPEPDPPSAFDGDKSPAESGDKSPHSKALKDRSCACPMRSSCCNSGSTAGFGFKGAWFSAGSSDNRRRTTGHSLPMVSLLREGGILRNEPNLKSVGRRATHTAEGVTDGRFGPCRAGARRSGADSTLECRAARFAKRSHSGREVA